MLQLLNSGKFDLINLTENVNSTGDVDT